MSRRPPIAPPTARARFASRAHPDRVAPNLQGPARGEPLPTEAVMLERRLFIMRLLEGGATRSQIRQVCTAPPAPIDPATGRPEIDQRTGRERAGGLGISEAQTDYVVRDLLRARSEDFEGERRYFKSEQATRLRTWISKAASAGKWTAVAQLEEKFAKVVGTYAPVQIKVEDGEVQRDALHSIIARMTDEEMDETIARQAELEARAAQFAPKGKPS